MREVVASGSKSLKMVNLTSKAKNVAELEVLLDQDSCQTQEEQYDERYFESNIRFHSFTINSLIFVTWSLNSTVKNI